MYPYKNKDLELNIQAGTIKKGNHGILFYSEDRGIASIRIRITDNNRNIDFTKIDLVPYLDLFMEDGSVFTDEEFRMINPQYGQIQYDIPDNVIKHVGRVNAKIILKNEEKSIHVADFNFSIGDSGLDEQVAKEINIDLIGDKIEEVLLANASQFKGEKGDIMKFSDLTEDEKEEIRGKKGDKGDAVVVPPKIYTRDEYNQLATKDPNTLYFISEV